jgi:predicted FMN-binding regulatory protein PaiB
MNPQTDAPPSHPHRRFGAVDNDDLARLIEKHPLAWVVSATSEDFRSTLLPLRILERDADGGISRLRGHFARSNPHVVALKVDPRATALFLGAHAYVSPSWMRDRSQAPTWNYASVQFQLALTFRDDPDHADAALRDLVEGMEAERHARWRIEEVGQRYTGLARGVVAFDARVLRTEPKYKLGQDEREDVYDDIVSGLEAEGSELIDWMRLYNRGRKRND